MSKMRVLVAFDVQDVEPGSPDDERMLRAMERIGQRIVADGLVDSAHVHEVLFYNVETQGWEK